MKVESFKGFEIWFNRLKMEAKMQSWILILLASLHLGLFLAVCYSLLPEGSVWRMITYALHSLLAGIFAHSANVVDELGPGVQAAMAIMGRWLIWTAAVYLLYPLALIMFRRIAQGFARTEHVRGAKLITEKELNDQIRKDKEKTYLQLGGVRYPVSAEIKHALVIGRPGSGKTVCLSSVIEKLLEAGGRGIVYDFKGDYLSRFYRPGIDLIFNPLDVRSVRWNLFGEVRTKMDIEAIAHSLVPPGQSNETEKFFAQAARDVFAGILIHCLQRGTRTYTALWDLLRDSAERIAQVLKEMEARGQVYVQGAGGKQAIGVHSTLMAYGSCFEYMPPGSGDFTLTEWLSGDKPGFLYITSYADVRDTLRPILSLIVDLVSRRLLSMPDDLSRRVYFILDEFGTLQRLSSIVELLTAARSKGGSVWLGIQDIGQIDRIYQQNLRQSISNACGTSVMFAVSDSETAKYASGRCGEQEYLEGEESQSMGPEDHRDGITIAKRKKRDPLVLPSEFLNLPDLTAYLKVPNYDLTKTIFRWKAYEAKTEPIVVRPELMM